VAGDPRLSFSLIVLARHEQAVLGATLSRLAAIDHPAFEVLVVVGDDDPETTAVAQRAARRHPGLVRVVVDFSRPKNKPKALNTALPACRGQVVGVFDAEDEVHPQLLRHVDARFAETGAEVASTTTRAPTSPRSGRSSTGIRLRTTPTGMTIRRAAGSPSLGTPG
jgi:glycosyltransferase XagB